jgi:protocatechuate 3,4-dioxygenase beta subunit
MKRVSALLLIALAAPAVQAQSEATLAGRVRDGRRPVAGARVRALPEPSWHSLEMAARGEAWTDPDGAFRISGLRAGWSYSLVVDSGDFAPSRQLVKAPATRLKVRVRPGAEASGRVVDTDGQPVEGAQVRLHASRSATNRDDWRDPERFLSLQILTGPDGRFLYRNLAPGGYDLQVLREGLAPRLIRLEVSARARSVGVGDFRLEPGAVIAGRVTDEEDRPVAGAQVGLTSDTSNPMATDGQKPVETAADGSFRLESLPPGARVVLWVQAPGFVRGSGRSVEAPTSYPVQIALQRDRSLAVRVVDPEKRPVPDAHISRVKVSASYQSVGTLGMTDAEGLFKLEGLDEEEAGVLVQADGFRPTLVRIPVSADGAEPAEIEIDRGAVLEGRVLDADGNPMAEASVSVHSNPSEPFVGLRPAATDREGRYRLVGVSPGPHDVTVEAPGMAPKLRASIEIGDSGDHDLDFRFPAGSEVSGQVVDDAGRPVPRARLTLVPDEGDVFETAARYDGTFAIRSVPDGDFRLRVEAPGFAQRQDELRVSGEPVPGLVLSLSPAIPITGRLIGIDLRKARKANVQARSPELPRPIRLHGTVDQYGVYRIPDAYPGTWIVRVDYEGRFVEKEVTVDAEPVALDLEVQP